MQFIFQLVKKRFAYPAWCELAIEADELEADYQVYREELMTCYINLCMLKPLHAGILEQLYHSF
jgi:hypothetical protein